jgi:hypothetical protein
VDSFFRPCGSGGGSAGGGSGPVDPLLNRQERAILRSRLANFANSHCNQVFSEVIAGYSTGEIQTTANSVNFYNAASNPDASYTQNQVTGNGVSTNLGQSLPTGGTAQEISGGAGAAIILGANFFSNPNAVYQGNILLHEVLHADTGWTDADIFANFKDFGLQNPNGDTEDISAWLSTDCTKTPASATWW